MAPTIAVMVYDYVLSVGEEFTLLWSADTVKPGPKLLYGLTRYSTIALFVLVLSTSSSTSLLVSVRCARLH